MRLQSQKPMRMALLAGTVAVATGSFLALGTPAHGDIARAADAGNFAFTNPAIESGLTVKISGRNITIAPGQCFVHDKLVTVPQAMTVQLPACQLQAVRSEPVTLSIEPLAGQASHTVLSQCRATALDVVPISNVLAAGSVKVRTLPNGKGQLLQLGKDYLLDPIWGAIVATAGGALRNKQTVYVDYAYFTRRLDTIAIDESGALKLTLGNAARTAPVAAGTNDKQLPLANIHAPIGAEPIASKDFLPIYSLEPPQLPKPQREHNRQALSSLRQKLASGQKVTIVFWGDSITGGCDASAPSKSFVQLVSAQLRKLYPACQFNIQTAAVGGSTTTKRIPTMQREVLSKLPDLVVIEFVNDVHSSEPELTANYEAIASKCQAQGVAVLVITPHWPSPQLMGTSNWQGVSRNRLYAFLRAFAEKNNWALADVEARWGQLARQGLRAELLLVDKLVHPNDTGHQIYAQEIVKAVR